MGKKRAAGTVFTVLAVFAGVFGLPFAPAAVANHPEPGAFTVDVTNETTTAPSGTLITVTVTLSPANNTGVGLDIDAEIIEDADGEAPGAPSAGTPDLNPLCEIPAGGSQCVAGITVPSGSLTYVAWADTASPPSAAGDANCEADRLACGSTGTEELNEATPQGAGGHGEPDNTDVFVVSSPPASSQVILDCSPDTQQVALNVAPSSISCTQRDQNGVTTTFEVDREQLGGPGDFSDGGQATPVDTDGQTFPFAPATSSSDGVAMHCFFVDLNTGTNDTGANGPSPSDGGDCAAEAVNPNADDGDQTDVVCIAYGSAQCPGAPQTVTPTPVTPTPVTPTPVTPTPVTPTPVTPTPPNPAPSFSDAACADGLAAVAFPVLGGPVSATFTATHPNKPVTITASNVPSYLSFNGGAPGTTANATLSGPSVNLGNFIEALGDFLTGEQVTLTAATDKANDTCVVTVRPTLLGLGGAGNPIADIITAILGLFLGPLLPGIPPVL